MKTRNHTLLPLAAALAGLALAAGIANAIPATVSSYSFTPAANWADSTGEDLTDGVTGPPGDAAMVGWNGSIPTITFDLGSALDVQTITLYSTTSWGATPSDVDISVSTDDVTYSTPVVNYVPSWSGSPTVATLDVSALDDARYVRITANGTSWIMLSEVEFDYLSSDVTPPTVLDIVDDKSGGPIFDSETVTYTVTFDEPMKAATVEPADFENAGSPAATINSVTATGDPAVYEVSVSPGIGTGTLQLQIMSSAVIEDIAGNALVTTPLINDAEVITVNADTTPPTLDTFADNVGGGPIFEFQTVIYTVTFSEPMNASTVEAVDFENAGSPAATINSVTATGDPAVYEVSVTPGSGAGTLQLQVQSSAVIEDLVTNALVTTPLINDPTIITVNAGVLGTITGSSYSADKSASGATWGDNGNDPSAAPINWGDSELFDSTIDTGGGSNVVGWYEASVGAPTLTFDLGGLNDVQTIDVWRRVGNGTVTDLTVSVSTDDVTYSAPVLYTPTWSSNKATIDVTAFADASYVKVKLGPDAVSGGWLMLTEVQLNGVSTGSGGNDFSDWIAGYSVGGQTGIGDDPDGDGVDSGVENFYGTAPDTFTQGLVSGAVDTGAGTFTFTHPQTGTIADDLTAGYRWSKDLATFNADGATDGDGTKVDFTVQLNTPAAGTTTVTATVDPGGTATTKLFVDVEVTQP
jgi:hypothetical protein